MPEEFISRSDTPIFLTGDDQFRREQFLARIIKIVSKGSAPLVCGVEGDWGSGKTSILHTAYSSLEGECPQNPSYKPDEESVKKAKAAAREKYSHVRTVWFEAWRYQNEPAPIVALLHEIRAQLSSSWKLWAKTEKTTEVVVRGACEMIGDVAKGILAFVGGAPLAAAIPVPKVASTLQSIGEGVEARRFETPLQSIEIRKYLTTAIERLLPEPSADVQNDPAPRLVVMIDDLDRCEPEAAFRLLEGIKIYLDIRNCIFLLGINRREIESAIRIVLGKQTPERSEADLSYRAHEYVEKLCPELWRLPVPTKRVKNSFAEKCWHKEVKADWKEQISSALETYDVLPANPRKIVSFCNRVEHLICDSKDLPSKETDLDKKTDAYRLLLALACLYQFHPAIYRILQGDPRFFVEIQRWCSSPPSRDKNKPDENLHDCLRSIPMAQFAKVDPNAPTPSTGTAFEDNFIDPIRGDVFRIQALIRDIKHPTEDLLSKLLAI